MLGFRWIPCFADQNIISLLQKVQIIKSLWFLYNVTLLSIYEDIKSFFSMKVLIGGCECYFQWETLYWSLDFLTSKSPFCYIIIQFWKIGVDDEVLLHCILFYTSVTTICVIVPVQSMLQLNQYMYLWFSNRLLNYPITPLLLVTSGTLPEQCYTTHGRPFS